MVVDVTLPNIDDNSQVVGVTSTGPRLNLPIGNVNTLSAQLEWSTSDYQNTGFFDQDRQSANLSFTRQVSDVTAVSLNGSSMKIEYPGELSILDYDLTNISLLVAFGFDNFSLSLEGGEYELKRKGSNSETSPLVQANAQYTLNTRSSLQASYGKSIVDLIGDVQNNFTSPADNTIRDDLILNRFGGSNVANVFFQESYSIGYQFQDPGRFSLTINVGREERDYTIGDFFEYEDYFGAGLTIPFGPNIDFSLSATLSDGVWTINSIDQERADYRVQGVYRVSSSLTATLWYADLEQTGASLTKTTMSVYP